MENEYCAEHRPWPIIKPENAPISNLIHSGKAAGSGLSSFNWCYLSSDDELYFTPKPVAERTPWRSDHATCILTATKLYLDLPPGAPMNWGQADPNLDDYHSEPKESSSIFWLPDITDWWPQKLEMHSKYANLSNVARNIFSIIPPLDGVEPSVSLLWEVMGWRVSKTTGDSLRMNVVLMQVAGANHWILPVDYTAFDTIQTENDLELMKEAEGRKLHRMAKVHNVLEMWQVSQILHATQKESHTQNKQMPAVGYIPDTAEIFKVSWSNLEHDGAAGFELLERSPFPPALSAKDLPGGRTHVWSVHRNQRIDGHLATPNVDSHLKALPTAETVLTGMVTCIFQIWEKMTGRQMTIPMYRETMASRFQKAQPAVLWVPHPVFPDRFSQHGPHWNSLKRGWWRSL